MTKSQQYFQDMVEYHKEAFEEFLEASRQYDPHTGNGQQELDEKGEKVLGLIRRYEHMLCNTSEGSKYGKFSNKTAETFWKYIRAEFPKIDFIGIRT
jgi:hypothetical protein